MQLVKVEDHDRTQGGAAHTGGKALWGGSYSNHETSTTKETDAISGVKFTEENVAWYFIVYHGKVVPVVAYLSSVTEDGKIDRLNILPM